MRRFWCWMLAMTMLLGLMGAQAESDPLDDVYFEMTDEGVIINFFMGDCESFVIPQTLNGQPVVGLSDYSFAQKKVLGELTVPETVKSIGDQAFQGSPNIRLVVSGGSYAEQYAIDHGIGYSLEGAPSFPLSAQDAAAFQKKLDGYGHTVGLRADGTAIAAGGNTFGECDMTGWSGMVEVAAGYAHTVGLKSDGTVVAVGWDTNGECNVSGWQDIVAVAAGWYHTVGLKSDGTVVATGGNSFSQCSVSDWQNIVAVAAGCRYTLALRSDGTVIALGEDTAGECSVADWRLL